MPRLPQAPSFHIPKSKAKYFRDYGLAQIDTFLTRGFVSLKIDSADVKDISLLISQLKSGNNNSFVKVEKKQIVRSMSKTVVYKLLDGIYCADVIRGELTNPPLQEDIAAIDKHLNRRRNVVRRITGDSSWKESSAPIGLEYRKLTDLFDNEFRKHSRFTVPDWVRESDHFAVKFFGGVLEKFENLGPTDTTQHLYLIFDYKIRLQTLTSTLGFSLDQLPLCKLQQDFPNYPGISSTYTYMGLTGSVFALHTEDLKMATSFNLLYEGFKTWVFICPFDGPKLIERMKTHLLENDMTDLLPEHHDNPFAHKDIILSTTILDMWGINYTIHTQQKMEIILVASGCFHEGVSATPTLASAINSVMLDWYLFFKQIPFDWACVCAPPMGVPLTEQNGEILVKSFQKDFRRCSKLRFTNPDWTDFVLCNSELLENEAVFGYAALATIDNMKKAKARHVAKMKDVTRKMNREDAILFLISKIASPVYAESSAAVKIAISFSPQLTIKDKIDIFCLLKCWNGLYSLLYAAINAGVGTPQMAELFMHTCVHRRQFKILYTTWRKWMIEGFFQKIQAESDHFPEAFLTLCLAKRAFNLFADFTVQNRIYFGIAEQVSPQERREITEICKRRGLDTDRIDKLFGILYPETRQVSPPSSSSDHEDASSSLLHAFDDVSITHNGQRFWCVCLANYGTLDHLLRHIKCETNKGEYTCDPCKMSFKRSDYLLSHIMNVHGSTKYACKECDAIYTHRASLFKHSRIHKKDLAFVHKPRKLFKKARRQRDNLKE